MAAACLGAGWDWPEARRPARGCGGHVGVSCAEPGRHALTLVLEAVDPGEPALARRAIPGGRQRRARGGARDPPLCRAGTEERLRYARRSAAGVGSRVRCAARRGAATLRRSRDWRLALRTAAGPPPRPARGCGRGGPSSYRICRCPPDLCRRPALMSKGLSPTAVSPVLPSNGSGCASSPSDVEGGHLLVRLGSEGDADARPVAAILRFGPSETRSSSVATSSYR